MAILIEVNKKHIENGIYYYEVDDYSHTPEGNFYIGIDPAKKIVYYYKSTDLENPIDSFNFSVSNTIHPIPGLNKSAMIWAAFSAYEALRKNVFPEGMGRQS